MTQLRQFTSFRHRQMTHCGIDSLLERLPVGAFTHWKRAAFARRTPKADITPVRRAERAD
jgi:hypothetical protein